MKNNSSQIDLFGGKTRKFFLQVDYQLTRPEHMDVSRIYLAKGSISTLGRSRFVESVCCIYPEANITECLHTPHNRIELNESSALALHQVGKKTLVFGELKSAVRFSQEEGNTCPNYWHFPHMVFALTAANTATLPGHRA